MCVLHCSNLDISRLVYFLARFMNEELLLLLLRCFEVPSWTSCHDLVGIQKGNLLALHIPPRSGVHTLLLLLKNGRAIQRSPDLSAQDMFQFFALIQQKNLSSKTSQKIRVQKDCFEMHCAAESFDTGHTLMCGAIYINSSIFDDSFLQFWTCVIQFQNFAKTKQKPAKITQQKQLL